MPSGTYEMTSGETESFRCAPGPAGWRYFATRGDAIIDLTVDASWHPVRVRLHRGDHVLVLVARDDRFVGERDGGPLDLDPAELVDFPSPGFKAAIANRLVQGGEVAALIVEPETLEVRRELRRYDALGTAEVATRVGSFGAVRWRAPDGEFAVAGDVAVAGKGFELLTYDRGARGPMPRS